MGRFFVSGGQASIAASGTPLAATVVPEMVQMRDLVDTILRSRGYDVWVVPDEFNLTSTIDWINQRAVPGDVALAIDLSQEASLQAAARGAAVHYIASNSQRRSQAEQLLQAYLRRLPQMPSRGAIADADAELGNLAFCRSIQIPSLLLELGNWTNPDDRQLLQTQRQTIALGIAEGLVQWQTSATAAAPEPIDLNLNGALYPRQGILRNGNPFVAIDWIDQLNLPLSPTWRRLTHGQVVYVRAVDLREANLSVKWDESTNAVLLRSMLAFAPSQLRQIMGRGVLSELQLLMFLKSQHLEGLTTFAEVPKLYREEAAIEGVNADLAFAQMCLETQMLRFRDRRAEQHNFGGLGGNDAEPEGASFASPRIGIRAHIQHLKAYASSEPLIQQVVDPRFAAVRRSVAPTIDQLAGRWNADLRYGDRLLMMLRRLYEAAGLL